MATYSSFISAFVGNEQVKTFRVLVYGAPGSGKTSLAGSFPKPLIIDTDKGLRVLASVANTDIKVLSIPSNTAGNVFNMLYSLLNDARLGIGDFAIDGPLADRQTIVIDTISALADEFLLREIMLQNKRDPLIERAAFDDYGRLKTELSQLGSLLKDVSQKFYVVVTALVDEEKDELTGALEGKPLMTGKYRDLIGGVFDEEYYLEVADTGGQPKYMLYATKYRWFEAKTRLLKITKLENPSFKLLQENLRIAPKTA
jgi:GTPase SAR1 family protein